MRRFLLCSTLILLSATMLIASLPLAQTPAYATSASHTTSASHAASTDASGYYRVANAAALHLRARPTTNSAILLSIPQGEIVQVVSGPLAGRQYQWFAVSYRGTSGYVAAPYMRYTGLVGTQIATRYPQVVVISLARQQLEAYDHGSLVLVSDVTTGRAARPTPSGTFSVLAKASPTTFYSPWPQGSPYYYAPTHINYAMLFKSGGFYIHDAWWKPYHGYGTNVPHVDPDGTTRTGSLGCVELPLWSARQLYAWVHIGAQVVIVSD